HFYTCIIESILTSSITIWYAAATANDKGRLQRNIRSAEKVIGCNLPSLQDLFASGTLMLRFHLNDIRAALIGNEWRRSPVRRATNRRRLPSKVDEPLTLCKCGPGGNQSV